MKAAHSIKGFARQRGPQGMPHTLRVRPRHLQKCFTERPPHDGDSSLGEAERLATEPLTPTPPRLALFLLFFPTAVCVTPGDRSQPAAVATDTLKNCAGENQESGRKSHLGSLPPILGTPGSRELSQSLLGLQGPWQDWLARPISQYLPGVSTQP